MSKCTDICFKIEEIQSEIIELKSLIEKSYSDNSNKVFYEAAIKCSKNAYDSLEQTKALNKVLSDSDKG